MLGVTRRTMLRGTAAAVLVPLAIAGTAAAAPGASGDFGPLTRSVLEGAVGSRIRIVGADVSVTATLERVDDLRHAPAGHPDAFTAAFLLHGDAAEVIEQGLVDLVLPGAHLNGVGLLLTGDPDLPRAVLVVDRRPISQHQT